MRTIPSIVAQLTHGFEAWVVGSSANPKTDLSAVRDWDLLVPYAYWHQAAMMIPAGAKPNTFGGWKFEVVENGYRHTIDLWPGDLCWFLQNSATSWIWQPRSGVRWKKQ